MQTGYDLSKQAGTSVDEIAIAATQASDEALLDVFGLARAEQARTIEAAKQVQVAEVVSVLQKEIERRGLGVPVVAATKTAADDFSGGGMLHALWIKFKEWLLMHNGYADYADEYAFASLKPRKEGTVNEQTFAQREAALLQAMASAPTLERQRELAHDLVALRHERTASIQADRDLDLANAVVRDTMTPVVVASHHTIATDWMGEDTAVEGDEITRTMAAAASRFYIGTSDDVRADAEEFEIQAAGMAQAVAGQYGEQAPVAVDAFVRHALFLNRSAAEITDSRGRTRGTNRPEGMGADEFFGTIACEQCAGKGWIDLGIDFDFTPADNTCPTCGGSGLRSTVAASKTAGSALASVRTAAKCSNCTNGNHSGTNGTPGCKGGSCNCSCQKKGSSRTAAQVVYHESYGNVSRAQLAAYRKFNVSPSDHDSLADKYGADNHEAITRAVKQFSPNGMFSVFEMWDSERDDFGFFSSKQAGTPGAKPCDACQGSGVFGDDRCYVCGGSGDAKSKTAADADITPYPANEQAGYAETGLPPTVPTEGYEEKGVVGDYGQEVAPENVAAVEEEGKETPMPGAGDSVPGVTAASKCSNCVNGNHSGTNGTPGCKGGSCSCSCRSRSASLRAQATQKTAVKAIAIYPDKRVEEVEVNGYKDGQAIVGGLIEAVNLKDGSTMWVNEEFTYSFGPDDVNWIASDVAGLGGRPEFMLRSPILGPVYITGGPDSEGNDTDIPQTARNWVQRVKREASLQPVASALDAGMRSPTMGFATSILATAAYGERSTCATCGSDIENHGDAGWIDRGGNTHCDNSGQHPLIDGGDGGYGDYPHVKHSPSKTAKTAADGARPIYEIAREIRGDWKNVYFGAVPYLDAMGSLDSINDRYGADDARMILTYFLSNASTWRGETAKRVKAEIKGLLGRKAAKEAVVWDDVDDDEYEDGQTVTVTEALPYGMFDTIIRFKGTTEDGKEITFAADHRMARPILEELANGEHPQAHVPGFMSLGSIQTKAVLLTNVSFDGGIGNNVAKGTDPSGKVVRFRLSDEDAKSLSSVLTGDLAGNFSGVTVDEGDIITEAAKTAGTDPDDQNGGAESNLPTPEKDTTTAWPWELPEGDVQTGQGAANVAGTPTPGGSAGYPQPKKSSIDKAAAAPEYEGSSIEEVVAKAQAEMGGSGSMQGEKMIVANVGGERRVIQVAPPAFGPRYTDLGSYEDYYGTTAALVADPARLAAFQAAVKR